MDLTSLNCEQVQFGDVNDSNTVAAALRAARAGTIFGEICNKGPANLTFSAMQSTDNGSDDAYATINLRIGGASVASVVVVPGGIVEFSIETRTELYLQLSVSPQPGSIGVISLWTPRGHLTRVGRPGYAYPATAADR